MWSSSGSAATAAATKSTAAKGRQIHKTLNNIKMTVLCGFVTILVLRGTIGAGSFGTPAQDLHDIRDTVHRRKDAGRVLAEAKSSSSAIAEEEAEVEAEVVDSGMPYSLGPKISDWDEQRGEWLRKNPHMPAVVNGKPRILLVTGSQPKPCDNPVGDHYLLKAIKNKVDYCRLHGIEIFYNMAHLDHEMAGYWAKLPLLRKLLLAHPEVEWIWWMDSDAMFTDMVFELPMEKYANYNFVLHGWDELVYNKKNWIGLNTGSFLIRNCQWTLDILDDWAPMGPKGKIRDEAGKILTASLAGRPAFEADDQSALVYLLMTKRDRWGDRVFLESSYYLHGYWAILVDKYEEMIEKNHPGLGDDRWPFVTHFVGCKPCGRYGDYPVERCLKQMERAFNFADNQILEIYGFRHRALGSAKVKRTRNETDRPLDRPLGISNIVVGGN
ncbi:glycosyltransferase, CAZy family GT34-like protein [Selaginella moellendorffii]|uniref:Glycosyltransferase, CAZy family GT34-like protein n=2 Tax=Selaginella moellendorffii TaxID=88036 RepID=D8R9M0_SELML|nr:xyloglucan alpha-1,6-glycosyltransferase [Selaginella moellendorffii]EFJ30919.1 glycosyltransferase, CAZy family GT34-like protein [Selaginella moellendorffii]